MDESSMKLTNRSVINPSIYDPKCHVNQGVTFFLFEMIRGALRGKRSTVEMDEQNAMHNCAFKVDFIIGDLKVITP